MKRGRGKNYGANMKRVGGDKIQTKFLGYGIQIANRKILAKTLRELATRLENGEKREVIAKRLRAVASGILAD